MRPLKWYSILWTWNHDRHYGKKSQQIRGSVNRALFKILILKAYKNQIPMLW
jgi:hypothetical protein